MTSSYCAPCIADLALVRDAMTSVSGTATCMAHAVLLTHSTDDPARRRQRLDALRDLATGKAETAEPAEQVKLELLVQEYGLAGAMDMGGPSRRQGNPPRGQQQQRGGQGGQGQPGGQPHAGGQQHVAAGEERPRKSRRGRGRGEHAGVEGGRDRRPAAAGGETAPVTPAPGPAGEAADTVLSAGVPSNVPEAAGPAPTADVSTSVPEPAAAAASAPQAGEASYDESGVSAGGGSEAVQAAPVAAEPSAPAAPAEPVAPAAPAAPVAPAEPMAPAAAEPSVANAPAAAPAGADVPVLPTSAPDA